MKDSYCIIRKTGSCKIAILDAFEYYEGIVEISRINVPREYRGQGYGSSLLREMCEIAHREKFALELFVSPSGGLNYDQLRDWYRRYGFQGSCYKMIRTPREVVHGEENSLISETR